MGRLMLNGMISSGMMSFVEEIVYPQALSVVRI